MLYEVKLIKTDSVNLYLNPSERDIKALLSKYHGLRGIVEPNQLVVADANTLIHMEMMDLIETWIDADFARGDGAWFEIYPDGKVVPSIEEPESIKRTEEWPSMKRAGLTITEYRDDGEEY